MHANGSVYTVILISQVEYGMPIVWIERRHDNSLDAGSYHTADHLISIFVKAIKVKMAVRVD